jgi:hypothetical protein
VTQLFDNGGRKAELSPANSKSRRARAITDAAIMCGVVPTRPPSAMLNKAPAPASPAAMQNTG